MKMIQKISLALAILMSLFVLSPTLAAAVDTKGAIQCGVNGAAGAKDCTAQPTTSLNDTVKAIINFLSILVGVAAIIMIIISGLRFIASGGNSDKIKSARNSLIYAMVGLVVVALAQVIVHFVLTEAAKPSTTSFNFRESGDSASTGSSLPKKHLIATSDLTVV